MTSPVIITVAMTGAIPRKKDCPGVPVTPSEQIEETHKAYEAGATLAHIHVRNPDESPSSDPDLYAAVQAGIQKHCPGNRAIFNRGSRTRSSSAWGHALSSPRYGLLSHRLCQFSQWNL